VAVPLPVVDQPDGAMERGVEAGAAASAIARRKAFMGHGGDHEIPRRAKPVVTAS
jgi:hypothetical protein